MFEMLIVYVLDAPPPKKRKTEEETVDEEEWDDFDVTQADLEDLEIQASQVQC